MAFVLNYHVFLIFSFSVLGNELMDAVLFMIIFKLRLFLIKFQFSTEHLGCGGNLQHKMVQSIDFRATLPSVYDLPVTKCDIHYGWKVFQTNSCHIHGGKLICEILSK